MKMTQPDTSCTLKTDLHVLVIRRGNSEFDYSWELYSNDAEFDRGVLVTGEHFVGGASPSFDGCVRSAEGWGFSIRI